jgi:hypothetical protein
MYIQNYKESAGKYSALLFDKGALSFSKTTRWPSIKTEKLILFMFYEHSAF